jgi:hypothetical protein
VSRLRMKIMIILLELVEISAENPALNWWSQILLRCVPTKMEMKKVYIHNTENWKQKSKKGNTKVLRSRY